MNELLFFLHIFIIALCCLGTLKLGKESLISFICMQGILSNLLVTKQMTLFGFDVTCSDVFAVGVIMSLNILQEYYGKSITQKVIWINFSMLLIYLAMTQIHLWYIPNTFDTMHPHFVEIFSLMPRLTLSSIGVYFFVQNLDVVIFGFLKKLLKNNYFTLRSIIALIFSQLVDTTLFSIIALYGIVESISHIIIVSFVIKLMVILLTAPFIALTKKYIFSPSDQR